jgi:hypothetical protein
VDAALIVDRIWQLLEEKSALRRNDPSTWEERQLTGFQSLTRTNTFNSIASSAVIDALDDLRGAGAWNSTKAWGAPLVTFPENERVWDLPWKQWHLDFPARGKIGELPGIRVLAFVAPVISVKVSKVVRESPPEDSPFRFVELGALPLPIVFWGKLNYKLFFSGD